MRKLIVAAVAIWWLWPHRHRVDAELQVGVTRDGFVAREGSDVVRFDDAGRQVARFTPDVPADFRVMGTRDGVAAAWKDKFEIALGWFADDGARVETTHWGVGVDHFCDGVASNDKRFAVAWAQTDGKISFVHGPADLTATVAPKGWCALASAGDNLAIFWRDSGRTFLQFCGRTSCGPRALGLPIERGDTVIGYGCVDTACLIAVRHPNDRTDLLVLNQKGQQRVLPLANVGEQVAITGVGEAAFAIAYLFEEDGFRLERVSLAGEREVIQEHLAFDVGRPVLAWARDRLLFAFPWRGGRFSYDVYDVR